MLGFLYYYTRPHASYLKGNTSLEKGFKAQRGNSQQTTDPESLRPLSISVTPVTAFRTCIFNRFRVSSSSNTRTWDPRGLETPPPPQPCVPALCTPLGTAWERMERAGRESRPRLPRTSSQQAPRSFSFLLCHPRRHLPKLLCGCHLSGNTRPRVTCGPARRGRAAFLREPDYQS